MGWDVTGNTFIKNSFNELVLTPDGENYPQKFNPRLWVDLITNVHYQSDLNQVSNNRQQHYLYIKSEIENLLTEKKKKKKVGLGL